MKQRHTLTFFISLFLCFGLCFSTLSAQNEGSQDSIKTINKYGLRLGADLSKLTRSFLEDDYQGFELNGDYRLTHNWYIAGEIGTEEKTIQTDFLNATASGGYIKAGLDYNLYTNVVGMENMIYSGFRAGVSSFSQQRNSYTIYTQEQYWAPQYTSNDALKYNGLSAIWLELILGIKAEVFNNLFIGIHAELKTLISEDQPDNFENLYIPGFNKTYDSGSFGVGYGYSISYLIPIFKKLR